jgi:hypothetical protein
VEFPIGKLFKYFKVRVENLRCPYPDTAIAKDVHKIA